MICLHASRPVLSGKTHTQQDDVGPESLDLRDCRSRAFEFSDHLDISLALKG